MSGAQRVVLVTQMFPPAVGGSAILLDNVYSRMRLPVTVLTDRDTCSGSEIRRGSLDIHRTRLDGYRWGVLDGRSLAQHARVARIIRSLAPRGGVVHCGRAQPEGVAALVARAIPGGPPFLFWAHGEEITTAQTSRHLAWVMRRVHAGAAAAIANSRHTATILERAGMAPSRIHVVYPGVDADRFSPSVDGGTVRRRFAPAGELLLTTVARLQPRKGHDLTLRALGSLRSRLPPFQYLIVGEGPERPRLESLAAEVGIRDRVSFAGEVTGAELPAYFSASDVFVHPNRVVDGYDFEGFGLVFLEAAAAGRPVIGGTTGGVSEAVEEGVTGLLVGGDDSEELASAIERLAQSPELRHRLGRAARTRVETRFTWAAAARQVEAIHEGLLADGRKGAPGAG